MYNFSEIFDAFTISKQEAVINYSLANILMETFKKVNIALDHEAIMTIVYDYSHSTYDISTLPYAITEEEQSRIALRTAVAKHIKLSG